jgi:hypothetical protein
VLKLLEQSSKSDDHIKLGSVGSALLVL